MTGYGDKEDPRPHEQPNPPRWVKKAKRTWDEIHFSYKE